MYYSLVIPVYNRPNEIDELLESLTLQTFKNFEVIVVEDGSAIPCDEIIQKYNSQLNIKYYSKENTGPGLTRNYGVERATGEYVIIFDSDCIIPPNYMEIVDSNLKKEAVDAFGGPDRAHPSFSKLQKAINYSMTSFFTTGGIRGGKKQLDKYYPRSFNMGVKKDVYQATGGFSKMRFGEDIDFSLRLVKANYNVKLFIDAWVYHKRRVDLKKFYKQVFNSGIARINLLKRHPGSMKLVHILPASFTIISILLIILSLFSSNCYYIFPLLLYCVMVFIDATIKEKSVEIGFLAIVTSFIQLFAYGLGFINAFWKRYILKQAEFGAYEKTLYD